MRNFYRAMAIVCAALFLFAAGMLSAGAQSLWPEDGGAMNLFSDRKAREVGDILTIVINESSKATRSDSANNSKSGSNQWSVGTGIFDVIKAASIDGSDSFKAQGSITNSNNVTGRVTVQVIEVKPNGNMVVSGTQRIMQNKDEHKIVLRGIVRRDDITADNTISSSLVADAELFFNGKGPLNSKQRQGILTQLFNFLF